MRQVSFEEVNLRRLGQDGIYRAVGAPTEAALLVLSEKLGVVSPAEQQQITARRRQDADSNPCGAVAAYNARYCRVCMASIAAVHSKYTRMRGVTLDTVRWCRLSTVATLEFDRDRKSMSVIACRRGGSNVLLVKGASECVLERCSHVMAADGKVAPLSSDLRAELRSCMNDCASRALRCLAAAYKVCSLYDLPFLLWFICVD